MVNYTGIKDAISVNIKYTGANRTGSSNCTSTTPTLLSGYISRINNIVCQLIDKKNKITALERLHVLEQQMELAHKKGVF